jgi:hypothetical protein
LIAAIGTAGFIGVRFVGAAGFGAVTGTAAEPFAGAVDPVGGLVAPVGDPVGGFVDPVGGFVDPVGALALPAGADADPLGAAPFTGAATGAADPTVVGADPDPTPSFARSALSEALNPPADPRCVPDSAVFAPALPLLAEPPFDSQAATNKKTTNRTPKRDTRSAGRVPLTAHNAMTGCCVVVPRSRAGYAR